MAKVFDITNTGTLSKNERRSEDWHPEYQGSINVEGVEYWLSAKLRDGKHGKFMSLKLKRKDRPADRQAPAANPIKSQTPAEVAFDDDIPF